VLPIALGVYMLAVRFGPETAAREKEASHGRQ